MKWLSCLFICCGFSAYAEPWKVRAREHYASLELQDHDGTSHQWKGFSNRFNIWKEKPFEDLYGFAVGPFAGVLTNEQDERIVVMAVGGEWKHFVLPYGFVRTGLYGHRMFGARSDLGGSGLLSVGVEYPVGPVGIALEYAIQMGGFAQHGSWMMTAPALGVHFYNM